MGRERGKEIRFVFWNISLLKVWLKNLARNKVDASVYFQVSSVGTWPKTVFVGMVRTKDGFTSYAGKQIIRNIRAGCDLNFWHDDS